MHPNRHAREKKRGTIDLGRSSSTDIGKTEPARAGHPFVRLSVRTGRRHEKSYDRICFTKVPRKNYEI